MPTLPNLLDAGALLDGLAIACCFMLILFLLFNRRKYGRFVISAADAKAAKGFANQVSLHMMAQQSQEAYSNLQQALTREFEPLNNLGDGHFFQVSDEMHSHRSTISDRGGHDRRQRYRIAEGMLTQGDDVRHISQVCGLTEGEVELLQNLQQFGAEPIQRDQAIPQASAWL